LANEEQKLWKSLADKTGQIQKIAEQEASTASAGIEGKDFWSKKKKLIADCDEIISELNKFYTE
jgi:hypothetical protein